jgi:hypothetical protein
MKSNKYDVPVLQMIKAFNNHVGEELDMATLRDEWYFNMGHNKDNKFAYWLDMTLEIANKNVKLLYKRNPSWYTEVMFFIEGEIET